MKALLTATGIRINLLGEEHELTADSYKQLGVTQYHMHDYRAALQTHKCELDTLGEKGEKNKEKNTET